MKNLSVLADIQAASALARIPAASRKLIQRSVDPMLYHRRNRIGRGFNRLTYFRRITTRYDKLAQNYLSAVALAGDPAVDAVESTS